VYLKNTIKVNIPESSGSSSGNGVTSSSTPYIAPKEEKVKKVTGEGVIRQHAGSGQVGTDRRCANHVSASWSKNGPSRTAVSWDGRRFNRGDSIASNTSRAQKMQGLRLCCHARQ
jgi:hypothetical protein